MGRWRFSLGKWELEVESGVVVGIEWGFGIWVGKACGEEVWGLVGSLDCGWGIVNGYRGRFCFGWGDCGEKGVVFEVDVGVLLGVGGGWWGKEECFIII